MRTLKGTEDLITGIIIGMKHDDNFERKAAKRIIEALTEENNLNIPPVIKSVCERCLKEKELKVCNECYCKCGFE
jgi:hypothetical protein